MRPLDLGALAVGALLVSGCGSAPLTTGQRQIYPDAEQPQQADSRGWDQRQGGMGGDRQAPTAQQIDRLLAELDTLKYDNAMLKKQISDQYMEAVRQREAERLAAERQGVTPGVTAVAPNTPVTATVPPATTPATPPTRPAAPAHPPMSREQLTSQLLDYIAASGDQDHLKALKAAVVSTSSTGHDLDPQLLDRLNPRTREQVARFHQMVAITFDELAANPNRPITRSQMIENIEKVFGTQPLSIENLQLCRRVDSFGVYTPFATKRFLSGRNNRMLVYVEVDNFHHEPLEDGGFEVRLEQQIELYDSSGETLVWRAGPDVLVDESRNKRRDFFIVYPVELPARLTAGKYRLKVRLADKHSNAICEKTLHDIEIVADQALVGGAGR